MKRLTEHAFDDKIVGARQQMTVQKDAFSFNHISVKISQLPRLLSVASQRGLSAGVTSFKP